MSRVANNPIAVPKTITVNLAGQNLSLKSSKGELHYPFPRSVGVKHEADHLTFSSLDESIESNALAGTARAIVNNMVDGLTKGFEKRLELIGVGYRAQAQGKQLNLTLGFSHPVIYDIPTGITIETPSQTEIVIKGFDNRLVGQVAADIRAYRSPEPYKGKGVRYANEKIILKETKKK